MTLSRPKMVEEYERRGSKILRSRAWIRTRCMIAYLSTSRIVPSPVLSSKIQLLDTAVFFLRAVCASATANAASCAISAAAGAHPTL